MIAITLNNFVTTIEERKSSSNLLLKIFAAGVFLCLTRYEELEITQL